MHGDQSIIQVLPLPILILIFETPLTNPRFDDLLLAYVQGMLKFVIAKLLQLKNNPCIRIWTRINSKKKAYIKCITYSCYFFFWHYWLILVGIWRWEDFAEYSVFCCWLLQSCAGMQWHRPDHTLSLLLQMIWWELKL